MARANSNAGALMSAMLYNLLAMLALLDDKLPTAETQLMPPLTG